MKCHRLTKVFELFSICCIIGCNGMFEVIMTKFDSIVKKSPILDLDELKVTRYNRTTFVLNGTFEFFVDSIEEYEGECNLFKKGGNDYKLLPYKMGPSNLCKAITEDEFFYKVLHSQTRNFPPLKSCDFKKDTTYYIVNFLPDLSKIPPVFQSGDYMIECAVKIEDNFIQGYKFYGQLFNIASGGFG